MKSYGVAIAVLTGTCALALGVRVIHSQGKASPGTVQVHLVVTDQGLNDTNEIPVLRAERSEEHTSELQSRGHLVCRLLREKKNRARPWPGSTAQAQQLQGGAGEPGSAFRRQ